MNLPPGMPIQSMPAGWLKQITILKEKVAVLEKKVAELEKRPVQIGTMLNIPQPIPEAPWVHVQSTPDTGDPMPPVKRGPGRPRKHPQA